MDTDLRITSPYQVVKRRDELVMQQDENEKQIEVDEELDKQVGWV